MLWDSSAGGWAGAGAGAGAGAAARRACTSALPLSFDQSGQDVFASLFHTPFLGSRSFAFETISSRLLWCYVASRPVQIRFLSRRTDSSEQCCQRAEGGFSPPPPPEPVRVSETQTRPLALDAVRAAVPC